LGKLSVPNYLFLHLVGKLRASGASGSVSVYAFQLACLAGYKVIATCSAQPISYEQSLYASTVFNAAELDVVKKIKALDLTLRRHSTPSLARKAPASLAHGRGELCTAVMYKDSESRLDVTFSLCFSGNTQGKLMRPSVQA
jgi:NADPH:quinone reductase-like Zn-dependent oxidoreductase